MKLISYLILCFSFIFFISNVSAQDSDLNCQYKEIIETEEFIQVLYDDQGNQYIDAVETANIGGGLGQITFDLVNKIPFTVSIKVTYDISHSGGNSWPDQEEFHDINSLETITIKNQQSLGISWGTTSVGNIEITYLPNDELDVEVEKKEEEICSLCGDGDICLDDSIDCIEDSQCGSGTCNIAGYCGNQEIIDCPEGLQNCNDQSCLKPNIKEKGEAYFCEFECKSGQGKDGICELTFKDMGLRFFFIIFSVLILIGIIYSIWVNKDTF